LGKRSDSQLIDFDLDTGPKVKIGMADLLLGNVHRLLNDLGDAVLTEATENLARNGQWVTGHLAKSGQMEVNKVELEVTVIFDAPYAASVEYGSRPHALSITGLGDSGKGRLLIQNTVITQPLAMESG